MQIAFDFTLRYGEATSNGFLERWSKYENCVSEISNEACGGSTSESFDAWSPEVIPFLSLLKLLPSTGIGRKQKKVNFQKSADSFISFENVSKSIKNQYFQYLTLINFLVAAKYSNRRIQG